MFKHMIFLVAAAVVIAETAAQQTNSVPIMDDRQREQIFDEIDQNKDGQITMDEVKRHVVTATLRAYDMNGDGVLTKDEVQRQIEIAHAKSAEIDQGFQKMDRNGDGRITADEVKGKPHADRLGYYDRNGDGAVTVDEVKQTAAKVNQRFQQENRKLADLDTNRDGVLSAQELSNAVPQQPRVQTLFQIKPDASAIPKKEYMGWQKYEFPDEDQMSVLKINF